MINITCKDQKKDTYVLSIRYSVFNPARLVCYFIFQQINTNTIIIMMMMMMMTMMMMIINLIKSRPPFYIFISMKKVPLTLTRTGFSRAPALHTNTPPSLLVRSCKTLYIRKTLRKKETNFTSSVIKIFQQAHFKF